MSNEDLPRDEYKYFWRSSSEISLQDFLTKGFENPNLTKDYAGAYEEATALLEKVTEKVESIKNDDSIPTRSNKKTGAKSKKEVREKVQAEATEQLKDIAVKHGYVCGKWLIFAAADKVDQIWSAIAKSLVSGPLHETPAFLAEVTTSSENENPHAQHLICVSLPDVYDKASVTEVMKILLRNHGVNLSGVKSDLYTHIGIDSKHPSGISSTVWKNTAVLPEKEMKELKDAFFADLTASKSATKPEAVETTGNEVSDGKMAGANSKDKAKPKLKKKIVDPFASEEEDDSPTKVATRDSKEEAAPSKSKAKPKLKSKAAEDPFATDDEDNDVEQKVEKSTKVGTKRSQSADESDDEGANQPKKKKI